VIQVNFTGQGVVKPEAITVVVLAWCWALKTTDHRPKRYWSIPNFDRWRYMLIRTIPPSNPLVQLSPCEQEIVRMVAVGHPNKVIAAVLNMSSWTVGTHLRRIFAKLGVASRAAMVARCMDFGKGSSARTLDPCKTVAVERKARAAQ